MWITEAGLTTLVTQSLKLMIKSKSLETGKIYE